MTSIHEFKIESISGKEINFADFSGKKLIIINVASECGYTKQYTQMQELHEALSDKLVVVACPCNDFGGQEPGTNEEIQLFCETKYKVSFPITTKLSIKGEHPHPLYDWLCNKSKNGQFDEEVAWNFHKFLLDEQGHLVKAFASSVSPIDPQIVDWAKDSN